MAGLGGRFCKAASGRSLHRKRTTTLKSRHGSSLSERGLTATAVFQQRRTAYFGTRNKYTKCSVTICLRFLKYQTTFVAGRMFITNRPIAFQELNIS